MSAFARQSRHEAAQQRRKPGLRSEAMARLATGTVVERQRLDGRVFALRFRAYGRRRYVTLGSERDGWTRREAEVELANMMADVRRGAWRPSEPSSAAKEPADPTFHEFASEWLEAHRHEFAPRTVEDYELALTHHLLPFFATHRLSEITAQEVDRYKALKIRERELCRVDRPLSNRTINKTLTRLGQILNVAVRYELIDHNPVKTKVTKLKEAAPRRSRLRAEEVQALLRAAGPNRALLATAIMAGGLRVSELTHLRWRDVDLGEASLHVGASKTAAGVRRVSLEIELVQLLREHKVASRWSQSDDFVFPGRFRDRPRERNSVRTRVLYRAIERANKLLARDGKPSLPEGITFHSLRRTYAALRAELGEHPAVTAAQMGHRDPRMTLRVYTDVTGMRPQTRLGGLLSDAEWAPMGTNASDQDAVSDESVGDGPRRTRAVAGDRLNGSDGTRTRGLRRDRPAL
jgi:integrase